MPTYKDAAWWREYRARRKAEGRPTVQYPSTEEQYERVRNLQRIRRNAIRRGTKLKKDEHGPVGYEAGCRCPICKQAFLQEKLDNAHGQLNTYDRWGCRCEECVTAKREENKKAKARRVEKARSGSIVLQHGTENAYTNYGCRCEECRAVWSERNKKYAAKRKSRKSNSAE